VVLQAPAVTRTVSVDVETRVRRAVHELKSPTALIITAARNALEVNDLERARSALELIERVASRALDRTTTILEASSERSSCTPATFLRSLVQDSATSGLAVELSIDRDAEGIVITNEPAAFEALVQSLLENAAQHGDPAHPVRVRLERIGGELRLRVANRCAPVDRHTGQQLGLPLVQELARRMGGTLVVEARAGAYQVELHAPIGS
jgi:signal transduction histidine kinase